MPKHPHPFLAVVLLLAVLVGFACSGLALAANLQTAQPCHSEKHSQKMATCCTSAACCAPLVRPVLNFSTALKFATPFVEPLSVTQALLTVVVEQLRPPSLI